MVEIQLTLTEFWNVLIPKLKRSLRTVRAETRQAVVDPKLLPMTKLVPANIRATVIGSRSKKPVPGATIEGLPSKKWTRDAESLEDIITVPNQRKVKSSPTVIEMSPRTRKKNVHLDRFKGSENQFEKKKRDNEEESDDNRPPKMPIKQRKPVHKERRDNEDDSDIESPRRPAQRRNRPALKPRSDYNEVYEEEAYRPSQAPTKTKKTAKAECRGDVKYQKKPVRSSSRAYTEDNDFEEHQYLPKTKDHKTRKQAEQRREGSKHDQGYDRTPPRPSVKSADRPRKPKRDYVEERTTTRSEYQYSDTSNDEDSTSETTDSSNDSLPTRWAKPPQHPEKRFVENNSQRRRPRDRTEEKDYPQRRQSPDTYMQTKTHDHVCEHQCRPPRNSSYRI
uniref:Uncharacterized protein n=1 Tax=Schistocephalus solidus TaxID=70667 RepID=A0A0X3NVF6_SCHSO